MRRSWKKLDEHFNPTLMGAVFSVHCALSIDQFAVCSVHCEGCSVQFRVNIMQRIECIMLIMQEEY